MLANLLTRVELRLYARSVGEPPQRIRALVDACTDERIKQAETMSGVSIPPEFHTMEAPAEVGALFDGSRIKKFFDWLKSDQGQEFIKMLFTLLITVLPLVV